MAYQAGDLFGGDVEVANLERFGTLGIKITVGTSMPVGVEPRAAAQALDMGIAVAPGRLPGARGDGFERPFAQQPDAGTDHGDEEEDRNNGEPAGASGHEAYPHRRAEGARWDRAMTADTILLHGGTE